MANIYRSFVKANIGTVPTVLYEAPVGSSVFVIGAIFSNITGSNISLTVRLQKSVNTSGEISTVIKDAPVPPGSAIQILNGEKIVMEPDDQLIALSDTPGSVSSTVSVMEVR